MFRLELRLSFDSGTYGWCLVLVVIGLNGLSRFKGLGRTKVGSCCGMKEKRRVSFAGSDEALGQGPKCKKAAEERP